MAYNCKTLVEGVCTEWQETSFLPNLATADRDTILLWAICIFGLVFVVRELIRLFK
ncbi:hypothetical protein F960_02730 [Acinetobacter gerneri DSM 14967 = CIP 107464 = MTCC 9824]|uniref:Uncharacterized protein n=1 Tax=Acinetobacter gerneri DSM 14967 = CIP 107464 = MTCC 9824 TaxID=1120926 RepID=N8ZMM8_9GAMM|nr:hypothetical protein F960_02730 [Acinetobacter gerneri DSM 14967 = CIP 107464 = MTCC 9824]